MDVVRNDCESVTVRENHEGTTTQRGAVELEKRRIGPQMNADKRRFLRMQYRLYLR
jgi:hypothetical protein